MSTTEWKAKRIMLWVYLILSSIASMLTRDLEVDIPARRSAYLSVKEESTLRLESICAGQHHQMAHI